MIRLIADSTCDLSPELKERYHVDILPLSTVLGEDVYTDGVDIEPKDLYAWSDRTKQTPKTAVFSIQQAKDKFRPYLDAGDELLCLSISESMSASGQVMRMAAEELRAGDRVHVVDSQNLSTGIGLLVLKAAEAAEAGKDIPEIIRVLEATRPLVRSSFVIDTMTYLHRGGRCSGIVALAGNALRIHPEIVVQDGAMKPNHKYRGNMNHVLREYERDLTDAMLKADPSHVFITHSPMPADDVRMVLDYVENLHYFREIHETNAGSVVSSHCGPNTLGILFIAKE
ncbi:MAG: DegV family protein [Clostridia bacterium]|nr:DegV family protein [Clostridia bacterium]